MEVYYLPCGCAVMSSMFDNFEVLNVVVCLRHHTDPAIQEALKKLAEAVRTTLPIEQELDEKG